MDCKCQFQHLWFLIAEETGVSGENDRAITSNWQTSWYKYVSSTSLYRQETIIMTEQSQVINKLHGINMYLVHLCTDRKQL
jgi:hypothetical protein